MQTTNCNRARQLPGTFCCARLPRSHRLAPPPRDELNAFLADTSDRAYEKAVDRLLADPRYGERWARHWMDIWRYSDWYGRRAVPDVWNSAPQIWRWRDWIVKSLNQNTGYDRMLSEMLAADEIEQYVTER